MDYNEKKFLDSLYLMKSIYTRYIEDCQIQNRVDFIPIYERYISEINTLIEDFIMKIIVPNVE
jgi:hypothetical protein